MGGWPPEEWRKCDSAQASVGGGGDGPWTPDDERGQEPWARSWADQGSDAFLPVSGFGNSHKSLQR